MGVIRTESSSPSLSDSFRKRPAKGTAKKWNGGSARSEGHGKGGGPVAIVAPGTKNARVCALFWRPLRCFLRSLFVSSAVAPDIWNRFHSPGPKRAPEERSPQGTCHLAGFYAPRHGLMPHGRFTWALNTCAPDLRPLASIGLQQALSRGLLEPSAVPLDYEFSRRVVRFRTALSAND